MDRTCGVLLPLFSLPSPWGVGTMGKTAMEFVDFLHAAGQTWWQMLPVGPTGLGNSPYSGVSVHAGNPMLIDLDLLTADGLLTQEELRSADWGTNTGAVDYEKVTAAKLPLLRKAFARGGQRDREQLEAFTEAMRGWLPDYALFMALRDRFGGACWLDWPTALRDRKPEVMERYRQELGEEIAFHAYVQYLFFSQWRALRRYAQQAGVRILGDLPMYVSLDSADVWAERQYFQLDETGHPTAVAGVPPDYFSEDGQLWGNPLYDWDRMRADGFGWWIRRVGGASLMFDAVRIDHFRGFESYWAVPAGAETAKEGQWRPGPGMDLVGVLTSWFSDTVFVAEDLGLATPEVAQLLRDSGLPGMRVLEFAFSGPDNVYLPHHYEPNCVCYTGTHDNDTVSGWYVHADPEERAFAERYLGAYGEDAVRRALLRAGMGSTARLFVAQMQDYLGLDSHGRINVPGEPAGNWRWRLLPNQLTSELAKEIRLLAETYSRIPTA